MYSAIMEVPHYWTADQVGRLLDALAAHNRHQARTAVLIMWRTGLRVGEVLELEWRDLDYWGRPATLLVRKSKSRRARTVRLHGDLVQLFANWPSSRSPRDKVVAWRCGRRCGTSLTASGGRTWTRNPQVLGSGALVPIPCGTVLPGGFDEAGRWRWQLAHMLLVAMADSRRS